jgi:hypothetical protein
VLIARAGRVLLVKGYGAVCHQRPASRQHRYSAHALALPIGRLGCSDSRHPRRPEAGCSRYGATRGRARTARDVPPHDDAREACPTDTGPDHRAGHYGRTPSHQGFQAGSRSTDLDARQVSHRNPK